MDFKDNYKLIAIDLSKQFELENPDLKQQINFIRMLAENNATTFFIIEKKEETTFDHQFCSFCLISIKMETQMIVSLLNASDNKSSKFATRKLYISNDQNDEQYGRGNQNDSTIKFETKAIKPFLRDYSDAYIIVTGDINVAGVAANTNVTFKSCTAYTRCVTQINDEHVQNAENLDIIMSIYNLIEYSDNYANASGSLYHFKRDESPMNDAANANNVAL